MSLLLHNIRFKKGVRRFGWATAEYFGIKGGTGVDDRARFQEAVDALDVEDGGGELVLGPRQYRIDDTLVLPASVSLVGYPNSTFLHGNHATHPLIQLAGAGNRHQRAYVKDISFGSLIGCTGAAVACAQANQWRQFINCAWNVPDTGGSPFLNGAIFSNSVAGTGSYFEFNNCYAKENSDATAFLNSAAGSSMNFRGGTYVWPATFNSGFIYYALGRGHVEGVTFDMSGHTTGTGGKCVAVSSSATDPVLLSNIRAIGTTGPSKTVLKYDSGALLRAVNLLEVGSNITRYDPGFLAADGSELELIPHQSLQIGSASPTIPGGIASFSLRIIGSPGVAPLITLPAIMYPGQELDLLVTNSSGGSWSQIAFDNAHGGLVIVATADGFTRSFRFRAMSISASAVYVWVCVGTPSAVFV